MYFGVHVIAGNAMNQDNRAGGHLQRWLEVLMGAAVYSAGDVRVAIIGNAGGTDQFELNSSKGFNANGVRLKA